MNVLRATMFSCRIAAVLAMMLLLGCTIGNDSDNNNEASEQASNDGAAEQASDGEAVEQETNTGDDDSNQPSGTDDDSVEQASDESNLPPDTDNDSVEQAPDNGTESSHTNDDTVEQETDDDSLSSDTDDVSEEPLSDDETAPTNSDDDAVEQDVNGLVDQPDTDDETSQQGPDDSDNASSVTEYDGDWMEACRLRINNEYFLMLYAIRGDSYSSTTYHYTDKDCTQPNTRYAELTFESSVSYPGGTTSTELGDARHIDITVESVLVNGAPASDELLANYQTQGVFRTRHTLVLLADGKLYTGKETLFLNGTTAAKRPVTLNTDKYAVLQ